MTAKRKLLDLLREARETGRLIERLPAAAVPRTLEEAYETAAALARDGGEIVGWKVGATSERGQSWLGLGEPFFGRVFAGGILSSGGVWSPTAGTYAIEPEIAFVMDGDLPPRERRYAEEEIAEAVGAIAPALEINRPSYAHPFEAGGLALIADNGVNVGACLGERLHDWRSLNLAAVAVEIGADGERGFEGNSAAVLGHPLRALTWLANELPRRGMQLRAGHIVLSGAMTPPMDVRAGQVIRARFAELGDVQLTFAGSEVMPDA